MLVTLVCSVCKNPFTLLIHALFYIHVKFNKMFKNLNTIVKEKVFWSFYVSTTNKNHLTFQIIKNFQLIFSVIEIINQHPLIKILIKKSKTFKYKQR